MLRQRALDYCRSGDRKLIPIAAFCVDRTWKSATTFDIRGIRKTVTGVSAGTKLFDYDLFDRRLARSAAFTELNYSEYWLISSRLVYLS